MIDFVNYWTQKTGIFAVVFIVWLGITPSSVYRVLKSADLLHKWNRKISSKGDGFKGPKKPHEHWHIDVSYLNILGTFYYLCSVLDGYSRHIVHWEIREAMTEADVEIIL